jgi:hypothetical protein
MVKETKMMTRVMRQDKIKKPKIGYGALNGLGGYCVQRGLAMLLGMSVIDVVEVSKKLGFGCEGLYTKDSLILARELNLDVDDWVEFIEPLYDGNPLPADCLLSIQTGDDRHFFFRIDNVYYNYDSDFASMDIGNLESHKPLYYAKINTFITIEEYVLEDGRRGGRFFTNWTAGEVEVMV